MRLDQTQRTAPDDLSPASHRPRRRLRDPDVRRSLALAAVIVLMAGAMTGALAFQFVQDPTRLAPTRDPAWYTWRTQVLLEAEPSLLLEKEGALNMLAGGYRVTTPVLGALLNRVAGVDPHRFTVLFMIGIPVLTSLVLGAFAYRHRKDPLLFVLTSVFSFGLLLTTAFVGYMDQVMVLFLLAMALPFLETARTSWGARSAIALMLFLASLTHPSTTIFFSVVLAAVTGLGWLANRFSIRRTVADYGPAVLPAAGGVVAGLLAWRLGLWGPGASFSDAVLVQPYPKEFFLGRLKGWWMSLIPRYTVPLAIIALGWVAWRLVRRRGLDWHGKLSALWLLPLLGVFGFVLDLVYPYYRFFNTSLALMLLGGAGAWLITRGAALAGGRAGPRWAVLLQYAVALVLVLGIVVIYVRPALVRWDRESMWVSRTQLVTLSAAQAYVAAEPDRPAVFVVHPKPAQFRAWALAKLNQNIVFAGLSGDQIERSFVHVGKVEDFHAGRPTETGFPVFDRLSRNFLADSRAGVARFEAEPMVFLVRGFNSTYDAEARRPGTQVTEDVRLMEAEGWAGPNPSAVAAARAASERTLATALPPQPRFDDPANLLGAFAGLILLLALPGLLAARWFGVRDLPSLLALAPGLSIAITVFSAVVVIAVHRAPFGPADGRASIALALVIAGVLAFLGWRRPVPPEPASPEEA